MKWEAMAKRFRQNGFRVRADGFDGEFMIASKDEEIFEAKELLHGMEWVSSPPSWW